MKVKEIIELLQKVSPDAEVMYKLTTDDQSNITILELEGLETYNIHDVLKNVVMRNTAHC